MPFWKSARRDSLGSNVAETLSAWQGIAQGLCARVNQFESLLQVDWPRWAAEGPLFADGEGR